MIKFGDRVRVTDPAYACANLGDEHCCKTDTIQDDLGVFVWYFYNNEQDLLTTIRKYGRSDTEGKTKLSTSYTDLSTGNFIYPLIVATKQRNA